MNTLKEECVELIATPFDAVLDLIRIQPECAKWNGFFRRITRVAVSGGLVRNNHLRVSLGAKSARFKQRLFVPYALAIDIEPSFDIIDGVDNKIERLPEIIIEKIFCCRSDECLMCCHIKRWVHGFGL